MSITRTAATATLLVLPLGLAACGGSSDKVSVNSSTTSSSSSSSPSSATSSSSAPSTATTSSTSSSAAATGGAKPTKAAATAGLTKGLEQTAQGTKLKPALVQKVAACIVDKTYGKVSNKTLQAFASADKSAKLDPADNLVYEGAAAACGKELGLRK